MVSPVNEIEVREALAKYQTQVYVAAEIAKHHKLWLDVHGAAISHERKRVATELDAMRK